MIDKMKMRMAILNRWINEPVQADGMPAPATMADLAVEALTAIGAISTPESHVYGVVYDHVAVGGFGDPDGEFSLDIRVNKESDLEIFPVDSIVEVRLLHEPKDQKTIVFKCAACDEWERESNEFDGPSLVQNAKEFDAHERECHMPGGACYSLTVKE